MGWVRRGSELSSKEFFNTSAATASTAIVNDRDVVVTTEKGTTASPAALDIVSFELAAQYTHGNPDEPLRGFVGDLDINTGDPITGVYIDAEPYSGSNADYVGRLVEYEDGKQINSAYFSVDVKETNGELVYENSHKLVPQP